MKLFHVILFFLGSFPCLFAQAPSPAITIERDIVYSQPDGHPLKLDVYRPTQPGPHPLIVYFHGGGWQKGSKNDPNARMRFFASNGIVAASVQYRFTPQYKFPAQVQDAKAAVRFLKSRANQYAADPQRVVAMGDSAGGYLALMLGATQPKDGFEGDQPAGAPETSVQAIVNFYGATDLRKAKPLPPEVEEINLKYYGKTGREVLADFTGSTNITDAVFEKIAVATWITPGDAPLLSFYGEKDALGGPATARALHDAFKSAGVPEQLVIIPNGGHGNWGPTINAECNATILEFIRKTVSPKP